MVNWTGGNIFDFDKLFFPVNVAQYHWTVVVVLMKEKRLYYHDSFNQCGRRFMNVVFRYIKDEHKRIFKEKDLPDQSCWLTENMDTPKQENRM